MPYPVARLIEGRAAPLYVRRSDTIREALSKMIAHDYSQLLVCDDGGHFTGVVSEQTILRGYFHMSKGYAPFLDLTVDHVETAAVTLPKDADISDALEALRRSYAVIVMDGGNPVGVLTHADTTDFFQRFSEGLMLIEDIETMLRQHVYRVYPDEEERATAIRAAVVPPKEQPKEQPKKPTPKVEELTFNDLLGVIRTGKNWSGFEDVMKPKDVFSKLLEPIRDIRNQLFHFRGDLDPTQRDALRNAKRWLLRRPQPQSTAVDAPLDPFVETPSVLWEPEKYADALYWLLWLADDLSIPIIRVSLDNFQDRLGEQFSDSLRDSPSGWESNIVSNPRSVTWLAAGWTDATLDVATQSVVLSRHLQLSLLPDERDRLNDPLSIIPFGPIRFPTGKPDLSFEWGMSRDMLLLSLRIDTGDAIENEAVLHMLHEGARYIEKHIGYEAHLEFPAADDNEHVGDEHANDELPDIEHTEQRDTDDLADEDATESEAEPLYIRVRLAFPPRPSAQEERVWAVSVRRWAAVRLLRFVEECRPVIEEWT